MSSPVFPTELLDIADAYLALLDKWNRVHSLTGLAKHSRFEELLLDSAAIIPHLRDLPPASLIADFGTGMGVPAIVIAAHRPDLKVAAIDRNSKKAAFVRQAAMELKLGNLKVICKPVEAIQPLHACLGTAKAVGPTAMLLNWWTRHSAPGAPFFAFKGPNWDSSEIDGAWTNKLHPYCLPSGGCRALIEIRSHTQA